MRLLKMILKATGKKGVPQGGVISPRLSNLYLNEVDRMLEKAIATTRYRQYTSIQYARFADDLVILIDSHPRHDWLVKAVEKRLREELAKLRVEINEEKSRMVDLAKGGTFSFLGFEYRRILGRNRKWRPYYAPKQKKRNSAVGKAERGVSPKCQSARGAGDRADQPHPARLGELLCGRRFESLLFVCPRLGREEGSTTSDASPGTKGLRLETVEYEVAIREAGTLS